MRDGVRGGASLSHRLEVANGFMRTLRGDFHFDESQAVVSGFPTASLSTRPDQDRAFPGGGLTTTFDCWPSPWTLLRLEYMRRVAKPQHRQAVRTSGVARLL